MKDIALQIALQEPKHRLNILREYLQNYILFLMQKTGMNTSVFFVGGTALRFLHRIRRYSEDLDFSSGKDWNPGDFAGYLDKINDYLIKAGYSTTLKITEDKIVQKAAVGFTELLYEVGLSQRKEHKLSIHIEIDINPPRGWSMEKSIVDLHFPVLVYHYDLPSLFSSKLDAVLTRGYTKGRDIFDLYWYLSKWVAIEPNFTQLNNAVRQKIKDYPEITPKNWAELLEQKVQYLKWREVENDILPFLESNEDLLNFTRDNLLLLLQQRK